MKAWILRETSGLDSLHLVDLPDPVLGPGQVLVRITASTLNYRDVLLLEGGYGSLQKRSDLIPGGDGAGEVVALGPGVTRFDIGVRVIGNLYQDWISGRPTEERLRADLGRTVDGMWCEYRAFPESGLVPAPDHLSDIEAATLPIAGLTSWSAVIAQGQTVPGDTVLVQGSGGVSLFSLQFAKYAGARVIATSSSDEKLQRLGELGADHLINYRQDAEWGNTVREITGGLGVDNVIEVAGGDSMRQSFRALRVGGTISVIGVLAGAVHELSLPRVVMRNARLEGITVGNREGLEAMVRAMSSSQLKPVVDRVYPFEGIKAAIEHLGSPDLFGKVCISI